MIVAQKSVLFAIFDMRIATTMARQRCFTTSWHKMAPCALCPCQTAPDFTTIYEVNMTAFSKLRSAKHPMFTKYLDRNMKNHVYCGVTG